MATQVIITASGVAGAGKTTLLRLIERMLREHDVVSVNGNADMHGIAFELPDDLVTKIAEKELRV